MNFEIGQVIRRKREPDKHRREILYITKNKIRLKKITSGGEESISIYHLTSMFDEEKVEFDPMGTYIQRMKNAG